MSMRLDFDRLIDVSETPVLIEVPHPERERIAYQLESVPPPRGRLSWNIARVSYERDVLKVGKWIEVLESARYFGARTLLRVRDDTSIFPSYGEYPILQWKPERPSPTRHRITFWIQHADQLHATHLVQSVALEQPLEVV